MDQTPKQNDYDEAGVLPTLDGTSGYLLISRDWCLWLNPVLESEEPWWTGTWLPAPGTRIYSHDSEFSEVGVHGAMLEMLESGPVVYPVASGRITAVDDPVLTGIFKAELLARVGDGAWIFHSLPERYVFIVGEPESDRFILDRVLRPQDRPEGITMTATFAAIVEARGLPPLDSPVNLDR